jgi:hypothetical protein
MEGMGATRVLVGVVAMAAGLLLGAAGDARASSAGVFQFVAGDVRVAAGGSERTARKGSLLNVGDVVTTARNATAQIKMGDGAIVLVQPQSRVAIAAYRFEGVEDGTERVVFRLEHGGFRSVTGAIGNTHKNNYRIETPIAQMGVRGTDHESYYFPPGAEGGRSGAYNKVNVGLTFIRTGAGEVVIAPNQVGFVASGQDVPALLPAIPDFFNRAVAPRSGAAPRAAERAQAVAPEVVQAVRTSGGGMLQGGVPPAEVGAGSVSGFAEAVGGTFFGRSSINATVVPNGAAIGNAGGDTAFGIEWGTWQGGAPTVNGAVAAGGVHFARSTQYTSATQLAALGAGGITATYGTANGPQPTSQAGVPGTLDSLTVGVNFATQSITSYSVNATVDGRTWSASGSGSFGQFTGSNGIALQGTCAGCTAAPQTAANGSAHGAFVGSNAERMITSFGLRSAQQSISGAASLSR